MPKKSKAAATPTTPTTRDKRSSSTSSLSSSSASSSLHAYAPSTSTSTTTSRSTSINVAFGDDDDDDEHDEQALGVNGRVSARAHENTSEDDDDSVASACCNGGCCAQVGSWIASWSSWSSWSSEYTSIRDADEEDDAEDDSDADGDNVSPRLRPDQTLMLQRLCTLSRTPFDPNDAAHAALLYQLGYECFGHAFVASLPETVERTPHTVLCARLSSPLWPRVGFQSADAWTDFRGGGVLALFHLLHVARHRRDLLLPSQAAAASDASDAAASSAVASSAAAVAPSSTSSSSNKRLTQMRARAAERQAHRASSSSSSSSSASSSSSSSSSSSIEFYLPVACASIHITFMLVELFELRTLERPRSSGSSSNDANAQRRLRVGQANGSRRRTGARTTRTRRRESELWLLEDEHVGDGGKSGEVLAAAATTTTTTVVVPDLDDDDDATHERVHALFAADHARLRALHLRALVRLVEMWHEQRARYMEFTRVMQQLREEVWTTWGVPVPHARARVPVG